MSGDPLAPEDQAPTTEEQDEKHDRRDFFGVLGKWSLAALGAALFGAWASDPGEAEARGAGWVNRNRGTAGWVNHGGGAARWVNGGGGGWVNRRSGWINGATWNNGGGAGWINRR